MSCPPSWAVGSSWSPGVFRNHPPSTTLCLLSVSARPKRWSTQQPFSRLKGGCFVLWSRLLLIVLFSSLQVPSVRNGLEMYCFVLWSRLLLIVLFSSLQVPSVRNGLEMYWRDTKSEFPRFQPFLIINWLPRLAAYDFQAQPLSKEKKGSESGVSSIPYSAYAVSWNTAQESSDLKEQLLHFCVAASTFYAISNYF